MNRRNEIKIVLHFYVYLNKHFYIIENCFYLFENIKTIDHVWDPDFRL